MTAQLLILAPRGRDAHVISEVLCRHDVTCEICPDLATLNARLEADVDTILVTEEALSGP